MVRFLFLSKLRHDCLQVGVVLDGDPVLQVLLLLVYGILGESEERESFSTDNIIVDWECLGAEQIRQVGLSLASEFELVIAHTVDPAVEFIGECVTCSTYDQVPVARLMAQGHRSLIEMDIFPVVALQKKSYYKHRLKCKSERDKQTEMSVWTYLVLPIS